eukprot:TRINITY_DN6208_c0_g2_i1.p1 TRINITY_DN6208_c0_g2~~TRINITY_DN6208_c0_g2_i1.p1  ORF type:complete len:276 (-),score=66.06 TRINITY_DN6208_c0_g2_i1:362-1189(-)
MQILGTSNTAESNDSLKSNDSLHKPSKENRHEMSQLDLPFRISRIPNELLDFDKKVAIAIELKKIRQDEPDLYTMLQSSEDDDLPHLINATFKRKREDPMFVNVEEKQKKRKQTVDLPVDVSSREVNVLLLQAQDEITLGGHENLIKLMEHSLTLNTEEFERQFPPFKFDRSNGYLANRTSKVLGDGEHIKLFPYLKPHAKGFNSCLKSGKFHVVEGIPSLEKCADHTNVVKYGYYVTFFRYKEAKAVAISDFKIEFQKNKKGCAPRTWREVVGL